MAVSSLTVFLKYLQIDLWITFDATVDYLLSINDYISTVDPGAALVSFNIYILLLSIL